jgi:hypothetical protein
LEALNDKDHPEHADALERLEWIGDYLVLSINSFNPEEFDLAEVNEGLAELN